MLNTFLYLAFAGLVSAGKDPVTVINIPYKDAYPCDLAVGGDGNVYSFDPVNSALIQVNTKTNNITAFADVAAPPVIDPATLPVFNGKPYLPCAVRAGPNGDIYAVNGVNNLLLVFNTATKVFVEYTVDTNLALTDLLVESKVTYFTTNGSEILAMSSQGTKTYPLPTAGSYPVGLYQTSNGDLYFTTTRAHEIGVINHQTGIITIYNDPGSSSCEPAYIRAKVNSTLYVTCFNDAEFITIDLSKSSSNIGTFKAPLIPSQETADAAGTLWYTSIYQNTLEGYNAKGPEFTNVNLPVGETTNPPLAFQSMVGVQYDAAHNRIYFTQQKYNRIGFLQLSKGE